MEAIKQIVRIPKNHEVKIKVPPYLPENEIMEVILIARRSTDSFEEKIEELRESTKDNLFLEDLKTIANDFEKVDLEAWE